MTGLGDILKQAREMQAELARVQEDLGRREVEASSGGGMVTAVANGRQVILRISIEPAVFNSCDKEMLEDLVTAAVNSALSQAKSMLESEMTRLAGGLNIPGLFGGTPGRGPMGYGG